MNNINITKSKTDQSLPGNLSPFLTEIFSEKYYQIIRIFRVDQNKTKFSQFIFNDNIEKIEIVSDLRNPLLTGFITFEDVGNILIQKLPYEDCRTFVDVTIIKTGLLETITETKFSHSFLLYNIEVLEKGHRSVKYKLHIMSADSIVMANSLSYSSRGTKSYVKMIEEVFQRNELPFDKTSLTTIPLNAPSLFGEYTTSVNRTTYNTIEELLGYVVNKDIGFLMLKYDTIEQQYKLISPKLEFLNWQNKVDVDNIINLPTEDMVAQPPRTANRIRESSYMNRTDAIRKLNGAELRYFDYDKREWLEHEFSIETVANNMLPVPTDRIYETKLKPPNSQIKQDILTKNEQRLYLDFSFREKLIETLVYTDSIEFNCYGVIKRKAGDIINLFASSTHPLYKKFSGPWMISRVYHTIEKKEYYNDINICRTHQYIEDSRLNEIQTQNLGNRT